MKSYPLPKNNLIMVISSFMLVGLNFIAGLLVITASRESQITLSHLEALKTNQKNLEQLQADVLTNQSKINYLLSVLPKEADIPEFIQFVNDQADAQKVSTTLNFASNQPSQTKDGLAVTPLNLNVSGPQDKILVFLTAIQSGKYQLRFRQAVTVLSNQSDQSIQMAIQADLYVAQPFSATTAN